MDLFARQGDLALGDYVAEVRRRNPSLHAARAAWFAAAEKYPQAIGFDDPLFQRILALDSRANVPDATASPSHDSLPKTTWRGMLALRGQRAEAQAEAAAADFLEAELRVARGAQIAFFDYYLVFRDFGQNRANVATLQEFREAARGKSQWWPAAQPDLLQVEVELAKLERRQIDLAQRERSATARLNVLVHREPDLPLPPPVPPRSDDERLPTAAHLYELALLRRPELAALAARMAAESAHVDRAREEFPADSDLTGRRNHADSVHEPVSPDDAEVNLPLHKARRKVAVREAMFRRERMQADYEVQVANIRGEVETARARAEARRQAVRQLAERSIPAAEDQVAAALAAYRANQIDFLRLVEAHRRLLELQTRQQDALASFQSDLAELERASGGPLPFVPDGEDMPPPGARRDG